jgi:ABC-2 type transport system permease protein
MMGALDLAVVRAIARKDLGGYLANPTGYVFLTLFIGATAAAGFLQEGFFARNLADLALLNKAMPAILMLFVPALTMGSWADERRGGTEEILLTLPVRDIEAVLGKYLGALGMYTVALGFSLVHLFVLAYLGEPDPGLMLSTYLGYWLVGVLFVAIGLLGSLLTANATVAFVLGVVGCAAVVFAGTEPWATGLLGTALFALLAALLWLVLRGESRGMAIAGAVGAGVGAVLWLTGLWPRFVETFEVLSVGRRFASFGEGVFRLGDAVYFLGGAAVLVYLCAFVLGRRHWS